VAVDGTRAALAHAFRAGSQRFLFLSSGAVYGSSVRAGQPDGPAASCGSFIPRDFYATAKRAAESCCAVFAADTSLNVGVARLFTCIGPGYRAHTHLAHVSLLEDAVANRPITLRGDGSAVRSYLYGSDMAVWLLRLLVSGRAGEAVDVGGDSPLSLRELALLVARLAGRDAGDVFVGSAESEPPVRKTYLADVSTARERYGLEVWTPVEQAVRRTLEHHPRFADRERVEGAR
jgi:nucleoside-diphosphate-sugar epimerase